MPLDDLSVSDDPKRAGQAVERLQPNNLSKALAPASSSGSPMDAIASKLPEALKKDETKQAEMETEARSTAARIGAGQEAMSLLKAPLPPPPQHSPEPPSRDPWSNWASPAMAMAMLASAFTRRPLTNALNAGAEVNNAFAKGDAAAYKTSFDRWKAETDYGIKLYEYQHEAYKDAIDLIDKDQKTAVARLKVLSTALGDSAIRPLLDAGKLAEAVEVYRQRGVATEKTKLETEQMREVGQAGHAVVEAGQRYRQAQQAGDAEGMRSALQDLQIAQTTLKTLAAPQSVDRQAAAPGSVEGIIEQRAKEHQAKTGQLPDADLMQKWRNETKEAEGRSTSAGQRMEREDRLYDQLKAQWESDPKNQGKQFTAQDEAALRGQAHASISGRGQGPMQPTLDEAAQTRLADQFIAGQHNVLQGLGYGNAGAANRAAVQNKISERAAKMAQELNIPEDKVGEFLAIKSAEYAGVIAGERTLGIRTTQLGLAAQEAQLLMPAVLRASEAVPRSDLTDLNRLILAGEQRTGDPRTVQLGIAINSLVNVYARAISPTGTPTVSDKDHFRDLMAPYWSKGQIRAALDQLNIELNAALGAPARVRQEFREGAGSRVGPTTQFGFPSPGGDQGGGSAPSGLPKITNQADYDNLPNGTRYLGPDGKTEHVKGERKEPQ